MNKNLYFIAAAALAFAACSNEEIKIDQPQGAEVEIGFETFTEAQTRATENNDKAYAWNLEDHHTTFDVWSTKLVASEYAAVHGDGANDNAGVKVEWKKATESAASESWVPGAKKYWDKAATSYRFFAAAPSSSNWKIKNGKNASNAVTTAYENAYLTYSGFTLAGTNIAVLENLKYTQTEIDAAKAIVNASGYVSGSNTAAETVVQKTTTDVKIANAYTEVKTSTEDKGYKKSWKGITNGDVDLMIAAACEKTGISGYTNSSSDQTVQLNFIHILSRLNVAFKKSTALDGAVVKVTDFKVCNLVKGGDFDESKEAADGGKKISRWTPLANNAAANLGSIQGIYGNQELSSSVAYYTVQSLVIPQEVAVEAINRNGTNVSATAAPYIIVKYTVDGEAYSAHINLATAFGIAGTNKLAFNEGWQNNLTVTLDALEILFDASTSEWADDTTKEYKVN